MSDPAFVASAYAIVLGGLVLYAISIAGRLRAARRTAQALELERRRDAATSAATALPVSTPRPSEPAR